LENDPSHMGDGKYVSQHHLGKKSKIGMRKKRKCKRKGRKDKGLSENLKFKG
jgi:hypothetical protein